jgi:hypothetical protein
VRAKGLFSFYTDGHTECCRIRKASGHHHHIWAGCLITLVGLSWVNWLVGDSQRTRECTSQPLARPLALYVDSLSENLWVTCGHLHPECCTGGREGRREEGPRLLCFVSCTHAMVQ